MQMNFTVTNANKLQNHKYIVYGRSPGSSEMQINLVTMTTVTTVGHKAHSMPQIDYTQRRRDKSLTVIENETLITRLTTN